jgi:hypothetical protein
MRSEVAVVEPPAASMRPREISRGSIYCLARPAGAADSCRQRSGSRRHARLVEAGAAALSLHRAHFCRRRIPTPKMAKASAATSCARATSQGGDQARKSDRRQRRAAHAEQWISTQVMDARRPRCMWRRWRQLRGGRRFCWRGPRRDHFEDWGHHGFLWLGCCTSPGGQGHESARCALPPAVTWSARATGQFDGYSRPQVSTVTLRRLAGRSRVHVSLGWLRCPALPGASWYVRYHHRPVRYTSQEGRIKPN